MDVRSYWISKLPTVRKQSPATGKLVESLLINDSSIARGALVEMAKISRYKLTESEQREETIAYVKKDIENTARAIVNITKYSGGEPDAETIQEYENHINELNERLSDLNKFQEYDKLTPEKPKDAEKFSAPKHLPANTSSKRLPANASNLPAKASDKPDAKEIGFFKQVANKLGEWFRSLGLNKVWDRVKSLFNTTTKTILAASVIVVSLIAGVYIYKKYGSIGKSILSVIISVAVVGLFAAGVFSLRKFFSDMYHMIVNFITTVKNKIFGKKKVATT